MWEEFKEFALKGNALSLAIGVIIGAAFGKIVDALVNDIIMPILGIAGKADFTNYYVPLSSAVTATSAQSAALKAIRSRLLTQPRFAAWRRLSSGSARSRTTPAPQCLRQGAR